MSAIISSAAVYGLEARVVTVEADIHHGLPKVTIVGLPDAAVQEARERIRSAIKNAGFVFPAHHISINLSPADLKKIGSGFDLPAAVAVLEASQQIPPVPKDWILVGELSLRGTVQPVTGVLSISILAQKMGQRLIVPQANAREAALINGADIRPIRSLQEFTQALHQPREIIRQPRTTMPVRRASRLQTWGSIIGQTQAKRAMTIAAAGGHNVLLIGSPGSGKSMLAKATAELLPPLSESEILEVTAIHSVAGHLLENDGLVQERPFRQPHHTASVASLVGGGRLPRPGELSLAHRGILFLDEFPEFSRDHIEALRQPLEEGTVTVSRVAGTLTYPASGMLIAAMNPCPCGFALDHDRPCRCSPREIKRYQRKISGPVLDRFDLFIHVPRVPIRDITDPIQANDDPRPGVQFVRRLKRQTLPMDTEAAQTLMQAVDRLHLSLRAYHRIQRVAQTIAHLEHQRTITPAAVAEAIQYRPPTLLDDSATS